jgi:hypothetical protein
MAPNHHKHRLATHKHTMLAWVTHLNYYPIMHSKFTKLKAGWLFLIELLATFEACPSVAHPIFEYMMHNTNDA